jgi:hypothetical protein
MLQPATGWITCSVCNASYESETKLRDLQRISHCRSDTEERPKAAIVVVQSEDPHVEVAPHRFESERRAVVCAT